MTEINLKGRKILNHNGNTYTITGGVQTVAPCGKCAVDLVLTAADGNSQVHLTSTGELPQALAALGMREVP